MRSGSGLLAAVMLLVSLVAAYADDAPVGEAPGTGGPASAPAPPVDSTPVAAWGAAHPECLEWSDSCFICRVADDGSVACSTAGVACVAGEIACGRRR